MDNQRSDEQMTVNSTEVSSMDSREQAEEAERCLNGRLHVMTAIKLIIAIGIAAVLAILTFQILYFRRSIFVLLVPVSVIGLTVLAIVKGHPKHVWPIIGISFFHIFMSIYALIIFLFFFAIKPLYIIMVLNWIFDTTHPGKTSTYYLCSFAVFISLISFILFNLWQLNVSLKFRRFLFNRRFAPFGVPGQSEINPANGPAAIVVVKSVEQATPAS